MMTAEETKAYFSDPLRRLENNHYALEKARERLRAALESRNNKEIYTATGELLLWVLTTDEWHCKHYKKKYTDRRDNDVKGRTLPGLRHAYNAMKHDMNFITIHQKKGGLTFPFSFPLSFPPITVRWTSGDDLNVRSESQAKRYKECLEGNEVSDTFDTVIEFLYSEYERIK